MEQLEHFTHEHLLHLVQLQPDHDNENSDKEDEDEDKDDIVVEEPHVGKCKMCEEEIYPFHICYYSCKECDYSLHKFCAQLPKTQQNHPLHPGHKLTLSKHPLNFVQRRYRNWRCAICQLERERFYNYHCSICRFSMDIICATMSEQKMEHPSHPHQLQRYLSEMTSGCNACGNKHSGTFYHCITCFGFRIHLDCALLPSKLLIQQSTNGSFNHSHLLILAYSFPLNEKRDRFFPNCRVCEKGFDHLEDSGIYLWNYSSYLWHYKCDKCRYYVHVDCATSRKEAFLSSILMPASWGKTHKNFKDEDHPNLIRCPFPDESVNLLMHQFINKGELDIKRKIDGEMFCHPHPLILFDTLLNVPVPLHDPMKRVELLCNGCVRPITDVPFYKCSEHHCDFVLHEWCTRLPSQIHDYHDHPEHTLVLLTKIPRDSKGVFTCEICLLDCNGFAYGCKQCEYYVDINCGFIPDAITHAAHPNHLLQRFQGLSFGNYCKACMGGIYSAGFHCPTCDFYLDTSCALLLPQTIRHKYDKHALSLRYYPAENHGGEYFCEICEDEFDPNLWFYHCSMCASSMHTACAPIKHHCERSTCSRIEGSIFSYFNVKFGGRYKIEEHPHPVTFVQGIKDDGQCNVCHNELQYRMILKCFQCKVASHLGCWRNATVIHDA